MLNGEVDFISCVHHMELDSQSLWAVDLLMQDVLSHLLQVHSVVVAKI